MPLSKIKVLLLNVNRDGWHSGNMIYDMRCIQHACDTQIYGPGWPSFHHTNIKEIVNQLYGNDSPDIIWSYFTPDEKVGKVYIDRYHIPSHMQTFPTNFHNYKNSIKIFGLSDFWARRPQQFSKDLDNSTFNYCFCCFTPPFSKADDFYSFFDDKIRRSIKFVAHPRCIDAVCFKPYGLHKNYDVITLGAMWRFYPFRVHMHRYLSEHATKLGIRYKNYPHCGTNFCHSSFVREEYAKAINGSNMLASCGGIYHLAFNKIFESMACKTLYVGNEPYGHKELHMKDGYNYINVNQHDFIEKIKYYLDNPCKMQDIVNNAYDTFIKYHTIEARANELVIKLNEIINNIR